MKKFLFLLLFSQILLNACEPKTPEEEFEEAADEVMEEAQEINEDFVEDYGGGTPEEVLQAKYDKLFEQYGSLTYEPGIDANGTVILGHSDRIAESLGLDYKTLAYIQTQSGTFGLQSMLDAMDSNIPEVAQLQEEFHLWHDFTSYDSTLITKHVPDGLSDQEEVEFLIQSFAEQYRLFSEGYNLYYISNPEALADIVTLTGLNEDDLTIIFAYGWPDSFVEILPDTWEHKEAVMAVFSEI